MLYNIGNKAMGYTGSCFNVMQVSSSAHATILCDEFEKTYF